ncbi:MAG: dihydropteroate synthase [Bacteroidetes bacterium]|nr:dihydropteroate synthase [Bacteroidota bacterium]
MSDITTQESTRTLHLRNRSLHPASDVLLMGILNVTPDSFSDGGSHSTERTAVDHALRMVAEGADIIDIGGESTRPGASELSVEEELLRVLPVLKLLRSESDIPVSIDTRHAAVAQAALDGGADMINDVSALRHDPGMAEILRDADVPVVLMHMKGEPRTMQNNPRYDNIVEDVRHFFMERIAHGRACGLSRFILDPGIGFGKTVTHNLTLLRELHFFSDLDAPILVGLSRKSFIGTLSGAGVNERLPGSIAGNVIAFLNGAHILRVHDIAATRQAMVVAASIAASREVQDDR